MNYRHDYVIHIRVNGLEFESGNILDSDEGIKCLLQLYDELREFDPKIYKRRKREKGENPINQFEFVHPRFKLEEVSLSELEKLASKQL